MGVAKIPRWKLRAASITIPFESNSQSVASWEPLQTVVTFTMYAVSVEVVVTV